MNDVLGIDIGGTFTDIILISRDGALVEKVPSTPDAPARAIADGIRVLRDRHGVDLSSIGLFCHGSTVATNALLEGKLPRTGLVVTAGFRDVLEIGSMMRPSLFDLRVSKPVPIVPRQRVFEVAERIDREGRVDLPLTEAEIARVVADLREAQVEAVAVCLLFSFYNPAHERALAAAIAAALPDVSVTVSSEVAPEINEYPRASTTAISAALTPLVARYVSQIGGSTASEGLAAPLYVMQSSGGVMTAEETAANAHRMILSGPAAGVLAAQRLAEQSGYRDMITFDMGGTSTDICLIKDGRADLERESMFEGRPLLVPQFAIHTIGAGGGSLARVDAAGLLRVGPESAGAMPGPACYGRGGTRPTVTDAHAVLGRIDPDRFLGGDMRLDVEAARLAVQTGIADPLGMSVEEAAQGVLDIADAAMARGVRVVSVNKGYDPRDFALVPFGGAGGMHALTVGAIVEVGRVVVPPRPGIFSAVGLASSDVKYDFIRTIERPLDQVGAGGVAAVLSELEQEASARLAARLPAGVAVEMRRTARLRYVMQDNKVELPFPEGPVEGRPWPRSWPNSTKRTAFSSVTTTLKVVWSSSPSGSRHSGGSGAVACRATPPRHRRSRRAAVSISGRRAGPRCRFCDVCRCLRARPSSALRSSRSARPPSSSPPASRRRWMPTATSS
nr:hydantoinase/oxoprolinase family protein [Rubellimicrobium mesophilum]